MSTEKDREILSALLDNEAGEREVQRLLAQSHDPELLQDLRALQQLSDLMNEHTRDWADVDLRGDLAAALDAEPVLPATEVPVSSSPPAQAATAVRSSWWPQAAIAASVMAVSLLVFEHFAPPQAGPVTTDLASLPGEVSVFPVYSANPSSPGSAAPGSDYQVQLEQLMIRHAQHAAVGADTLLPLLRLTRFEPDANTP